MMGWMAKSESPCNRAGLSDVGRTFSDCSTKACSKISTEAETGMLAEASTPFCHVLRPAQGADLGSGQGAIDERRDGVDRVLARGDGSAGRIGGQRLAARIALDRCCAGAIDEDRAAVSAPAVIVADRFACGDRFG